MGLKLIILSACAILALALAQQSQGGPHENQGRVRRQAEYNQAVTTTFPPEANWTACDVNIDSILSCYDCNTRLICKPIGGFLRPCRNPSKPYCNGGLCSVIPNPDCTS